MKKKKEKKKKTLSYQEWRSQLVGLNGDVTHYQDKLDSARTRRNEFLRETVGLVPGEIATVESTVEMVNRVFDMKARK